jgi:hypothetical protein
MPREEKEDSFAIYLKYKSLEDMVKIVIFYAQSAQLNSNALPYQLQ